ncbi:DNA polymerase III subunit beta [Gammaproteobacteria bacterium]|nr:DNA polymerase III subunit beta [Gammaproteobacteria bacterium]
MSTQTTVEKTCLFTISRDSLLAGLKHVSGVVESSQVMQILSYVKLSGSGSQLDIMASNSEVEVVTSARLFSEAQEPFSIAVSCRKLSDIAKLLPDGSVVEFTIEDQWVTVKSEDAEFKLASLPSTSFPRLPELEVKHQFSITEIDLKSIIEKTSFSIAYQDARFFLNGLLFECDQAKLNCVATDGHRLSWASVALPSPIESNLQSIVPRKTVTELTRLLRDSDERVNISLSAHAIEIVAGHFVLRSNLIEGKYPNYSKLIPTSLNSTATVEVKQLKLALGRVAILANEKFKGAKFNFSKNALKITSRNFDQEAAESNMSIEYDGQDRVVAFNIGYVLDVLSVIESDIVKFQFSDSMQGVLLEQPNTDSLAYVIMPLTL